MACGSEGSGWDVLRYLGGACREPSPNRDGNSGLHGRSKTTHCDSDSPRFRSETLGLFQAADKPEGESGWSFERSHESGASHAMPWLQTPPMSRLTAEVIEDLENSVEVCHTRPIAVEEIREHVLAFRKFVFGGFDFVGHFLEEVCLDSGEGLER